jgi:DNA-binding Lrp family transcriptional regulator
MSPLTAPARAFINRFQGGFPIVGRPFRGVAARLGMTETDLIQMLRRLLDEGLLSRFGPLYDASRLGGSVTLAALAVPEPDFERVAGLVNALPAVAHNYRREHALNMWFVVASERPEGVAECLSTIAGLTGLQVYNLPKLHEFYLGLWLELDAAGRVDTVPVPLAQAAAPAGPLSPLQQRIVAATQAGLPMVAEPYAQLAAELDLSLEGVTGALDDMLASGIIRRIGAVPNHYRLGLRGNGMTVWDVPDERVVELGERIGRLDFVSHCYQRPRHPGVWPYNLFAMVHGRDREAVLDKAERLRLALGDAVRAHDVLFSSAVLKKTGLRLAA